MMRIGGLAACTIAIALAIGCDYDRSSPGLRGECGHGGGTVLECDDAPIETAEDACWRLAECGSIPVANPEDEPNCCFDWATCVDFVDRLPDFRRELVLACVEGSSCDELWSNGSPDSPSRSSENLPLCLQYGDQ